MSEKKRKIKSSEDARPKKKQKAVSFDDKPISVSVAEDSSLWTPIFVDSPGFELPENTSFQAYRKSRETKEKLSKSESYEVLLHSATHPRLDYVAREPPADSFEGGMKHYVGVYDPETSSLQIIPAKQLTVRSSLKRAFAVDQKFAAQQAADTANSQNASSRYAAQTALNDAFGTKKAKKALKSAAANMVAAPAGGAGDATLTDHTQAIIESSTMLGNGEDDGGDLQDRKAALTELVNDAHPRPTPNLDAEKPADVYKLVRVVGNQEMDLIDVDDWIAAEGKGIKTASRFVSFRLIAITALQQKGALKALKFLMTLLHWINSLEGKGQGRRVPRKDDMDRVMEGHNRQLVRKITQRFAPDRKSLNAWDVQRVMLHACAIALVLDDCSTDMHDLQEDLKLTTKEIKDLYKALGCTVSAPSEKDMERRGIPRAAAAKHHIASLRIPFELPEVKQKRVVKRR